MPKISLKKIAGIIEGRVYGSGDTIISDLLYDSRRIVSPSGSLFFALVGERHNGHDYIPGLYRCGVKSFIVSQLPAEIKKFDDACFVLVNNTLDALQKLAKYNRTQFKGELISITGSNGKTITKEWAFQILAGKYRIVRSPRSYNSQIGVPLSVWLLDENFDIGIIEAGISKPGEMEKLEAIIKPDIGIFTNIGEAHQQNFSSLTQKVNEKLLLFRDARVIIYCSDYKLIDDRIKSNDFGNEKKTFTWSFKKHADLRIIDITTGKTKTDIKAEFKGECKEISIPFIDKASIENALHVWCLSIYLDQAEASIKKAMISLDPVAMRLEQKKGINDCTLINDAYNSDMGSLSIALDFLNLQNQNRKKTLILSDIFQSGRVEEELYREVSNLIKAKGINRLIGIGEAISKYQELISGEKQFFRSTSEFIDEFKPGNFNDEAILLKGARDFRFEDISGLLEKQSHQTVLEIDLDAMVFNLNYFRSKLKPDTRIMVMVKAFSYGSGTYEIANMLQYQDIDYLAVAYSDEGVELRKAGITLPIMVMNPQADNFESMLRFNLEPEIFCFNILDEFLIKIKRSGFISFPFHIKLDTGMHRLGFLPGEVDVLIEKLLTNPELYVKSVFTHLAASEEPEHDEFTDNQVCLFEELSGRIINNFDYPVIRHVLNSAGIERHPRYMFDMVRLGIGLYGISSLNPGKLMNTGTFKTTVSQVKQIPAKNSVGYGRKGIKAYEREIAILPVGYADGFNRKLGNGIGQCFTKGKMVPVVGNICMDMCMIDVTGIDSKVGDEVEIFGKHNPVTTLAEKIDTIPYEILTAISERVKRIYFHE